MDSNDKTLINDSVARPTRVRYWVIVFAVTLSVITYIDRVCISQAAPQIQKDLNITTQQMGWTFSAFFWAYALFEIPSGWLGDRIGARKVLMRIVIWWSFFIAATGCAVNMVWMFITRALFGAGEAGCYPNLTRAFTNWLPQSERIRSQGLIWLSSRWGGAFTPFLVVVILQYMSWRYTFGIFGLLGIIWAVFFFIWFRDNPRDKKSVNAAELVIIPRQQDVVLGHDKIPWGKLAASKTVWLLWLQFFFLNFGAVFYITWLPTFLQETWGFDLAQHPLISQSPWLVSHPQFVKAIMAGIPLFFGGLGSLFCGTVAAPLANRLGNVKLARRLLAGAGFLGASILLVSSVAIKDPFLAILAMGFASFCNDLVMPISWGTCMDIGRKFAGTLSGSMNMMGNFGGGLAAIVIGYILAWSNHNWNAVLYVAAGVYFLGTFCWLVIDPVTPIETNS
ncbi:MAG: MFS transporter [Sedimentisphaerales bacterium]|jgi:MFS family permease